MPEPEEDDQVSNRPFWSGTITFGLVSVPVNLYPANRGSSRVSLHMYGPSGVRLKRRYYSEDTGKDLDADQIVRGYETEKGKFVVVTDEELERLAPEKSRDIDLRRFVPYGDIPKLYFERGYFLAPAGGSAKAYKLLAQTMEKQQMAGIATFVMRGKEYLVAIVAEDGLLRAETLRFHDEIRTPDDIGLPAKGRPPKPAVQKFEQFIKKNSIEELPANRLENAEAQRLLALIARKEKRDKDVVRPRGSKAQKDNVVDLLDVLRQAIAKTRKGGGDESTGDDDLDSLSREVLAKRAAKLKIAGRGSMSKAQLIKAIRAAA